MSKFRYTPFLKLKVNEVGAISELKSEVKAQITPFFDLPRKDGMTETSFCSMVEKSAKKSAKYLKSTESFYLDNYDIPDAITVQGKPNYSFVIEEFSESDFIPVIGLDRSTAHVQTVIFAKRDGLLISNKYALRLSLADLASYDLVKDEIAELIQLSGQYFSSCDLILDARVCGNINPDACAVGLAKFISSAIVDFKFDRIVVAGSSIPAAIGDVIPVNQTLNLERIEIKIFNALLQQINLPNLSFGDYTIVSPMYSDVTLPPEVMRNVTAPKVLYSYDGVHFIARGGALKTHPRGNYQYNDIAASLVQQPFFRGPKYSHGDKFLKQKELAVGKMVTPSSILSPTINAHITYMVTDHPLLN